MPSPPTPLLSIHPTLQNRIRISNSTTIRNENEHENEHEYEQNDIQPGPCARGGSGNMPGHHGAGDHSGDGHK